jgi:hypothetical protein
MNLFVADQVDEPEARPASERLTVLLEGSVPQHFLHPPKAIISDCTAVTAVTSSLDSHGVAYLHELLHREPPPDVRLVLLVHATYPTKEKDLFDLITLLKTNRLKVWPLTVEAWGKRCTWVLCVRRESPVHVLWTSAWPDRLQISPPLFPSPGRPADEARDPTVTSRIQYTECPVCGLAQSSNNNCRRCNSELAAANLEAWDAAAFQAWLEEVEPDSEEKGQQSSYDVRPHPQRNVGAQAWGIGDWRLELRRQEEIWWINHCPLGLPSDGDGGSQRDPTRRIPNVR